MGNGQSPALPRPHSPLSAHTGDFYIYFTGGIYEILQNSVWGEEKTLYLTTFLSIVGIGENLHIIPSKFLLNLNP